MKSCPLFGVACLAGILPIVTGCHSTQIDVTVENRTGANVRLLEVDYPNASFGANAMASGAVVHNRIQIQGSGNLKVIYTAEDGQQAQLDGPKLSEHEEGKLEIVLLPGHKAEFHR